MTDKERLIELLEHEKAFPRNLTDDERRERLADYLLENSVIVPPCKIGDKIYELISSRDNALQGIVERIVTGFHYTKEKHYGKLRDNQYLVVVSQFCNWAQHISINKIGKTVFLTREEAEQALKDGDSNG